MSDVQQTVNTPDNSIVQIDRSLFTRIEEQQTRVSETSTRLIRATNEHKDAKKAHDSATETLTGLIAAMVRKVNGISDHAPTPLFDNMSDAVDAANSDPIVQKLLNRMIDHGISHLNALVVAGYDESQRTELSRYLDALDEVALQKAAIEQSIERGDTEALPAVPDAPEMPAFLQPQEEPAIDEDTIAETLSGFGIVLKKKQVRLMSQEQRRTVMAWKAECSTISERLGDAATADDFPAPPSFVLNPGELEPTTEQEMETAQAEGQTSEAPAEKKARAPRRSSSKFQNKPRVVKAKAAKRR